MNELFTEKFRPNKLDNLILPDRIRKEVENGLQQNILLYSSAGRGKTTLAKILSKDFDTLYINVSDDSGIDTIRETISEFCGTLSVFGDSEQMKCVILDEMDGASQNFYKALRATMEKYAPVARFIGTCNYINKIPEPIQSRFECINFEFINKEEEKQVKIGYIKRVLGIFKLYGIKCAQETAIAFVNRNFPDMRTILNKIQSFVSKGITEINIDDLKDIDYTYNDLFELVMGEPKPEANYKMIMSNYSTKVDDVLTSFGNEFPQYIKEHNEKLMTKLPQIIITVAEHQAQRIQVIDPVITLLSCCFKIQQILHS